MTEPVNAFTTTGTARDIPVQPDPKMRYTVCRPDGPPHSTYQVRGRPVIVSDPQH